MDPARARRFSDHLVTRRGGRKFGEAMFEPHFTWPQKLNVGFLVSTCNPTSHFAQKLDHLPSFPPIPVPSMAAGFFCRVRMLRLI